MIAQTKDTLASALFKLYHANLDLDGSFTFAARRFMSCHHLMECFGRLCCAVTVHALDVGLSKWATDSGKLENGISTQSQSSRDLTSGGAVRNHLHRGCEVNMASYLLQHAGRKSCSFTRGNNVVTARVELLVRLQCRRIGIMTLL